MNIPPPDQAGAREHFKQTQCLRYVLLLDDAAELDKYVQMAHNDIHTEHEELMAGTTLSYLACMEGASDMQDSCTFMFHKWFTIITALVCCSKTRNYYRSRSGGDSVSFDEWIHFSTKCLCAMVQTTTSDGRVSDTHSDVFLPYIEDFVSITRRAYICGTVEPIKPPRVA